MNDKLKKKINLSEYFVLRIEFGYITIKKRIQIPSNHIHRESYLIF